MSSSSTQNAIQQELQAAKEGGEYVICDNTQGKSSIWVSFGLVYHRPTNKKMNMAACKTCKKTFVFKANTGTSTMAKHTCPMAESQTGAANIFFKVQKVTDAMKAKMTTALADFCASDMRAFEAVAGKGFKSLIQTVLDIGVASSGHIDVENLLSCPTTVRRNVEVRASLGRIKLSELLRQHLSSGLGMASTLDMWTDTVKKTSFMSITAHYINKDFELHARTLHVTPVPEASHTAVMVLTAFKDGLKVFGIKSHDYKQVTVVSDSGSNCCGADGIPSMFTWLACLDHKLATVLTTVVNKTTKTKDGIKSKPYYRHQEMLEMSPLFEMIDQSKKLVEFFKRSNLQSQLTKTLKQENATRWNSLLRCLKSILEMIDEVTEILRKKEALRRIVEIRLSLLEEFVTFLEVFQVATLSLEQFKAPTLHMVAYWRYRLVKHLEPRIQDVNDTNGVVISKADSAPIVAIKQILMPIMMEKFVVHDIHVKAALLCPMAKRRLMAIGIPQHRIDTVKQQLRIHMYVYNYEVNNDDDIIITPPPSKKRRITQPIADMYEIEEDNASGGSSDENPPASNFERRIDIEFKAYFAYTITSTDRTRSEKDGQFQVLLWWKLLGFKLFPLMSQVARSILCVPASSAMSENNFSDAGNTITKKRNRLKPRVVNDLMFVRSNRDLCYN
jgi:hypothetical protein